MSESWLILETSGRVGQAAVARAGAVARSAELDASRRHARDLAPVCAQLLEAEGLRPADLTGVMVSLGPGSYTGLRVGAMSAKALAYATGCRLVAVETFAAIAEQAPASALVVDAIGDALQGLLYVQRFVREVAGEWRPVEPIRIASIGEWLGSLTADVWVSGPAVAMVEPSLPVGTKVVPEAERAPRVESILRVGLRAKAATREELLTLEPLYLRGSSAEEKAKREAGG